MKKIITAILTIAMVISISAISAFAATETRTSLGDREIDVKAIYSDKVSVPIVYSVDIEWGTMEFTYTETGTKTWNPENKQYTVNTTAAWTAKGNDITVTNHSNKSVTVGFEFSAINTYNTVRGNFSNASVYLSAADDEDITVAELTGSTALTLSGTLDKEIDTLTNVGKITVTIE